MTTPINRYLVIVIGTFVMVGCIQQSPVSLSGRYTSKNDHGVFVFRSGGVVGYNFAVKFDFYSESHLPPIQGHYRIVGKQIELSDLPVEQPKFRLEMRDGGRSFLLIRKEKNGTLPDRAFYQRD